MIRYIRFLPFGCALLCGLLVVVAPLQAQRLVATRQGFPGLWAGRASWVDYDGDGDLDVALMGEMSGTDGRFHPAVALYINYAGGLFQEATSAVDQVQGTYHGDLAWADYDGDGDPDLAVVGWDASNTPTLRLYTNEIDDAGERVLRLDRAQVDAHGQPVLTGVRYAALSWADYDGDGDLDLAVTGMETNGTSLTRLYTNDHGVLHVDESNSEAVVNLHHGSLAWGDYDNDGDLDLAVSGENVTSSGGLGPITEFYVNEPTGALSLDQSISVQAPLKGGSLAWADYDADGNLDLAVSGRRADWTPTVQLYRNRPSGVLTMDDRFRLSTARRIDGALAWGDYDNDGDPDLAATGRTAMSGDAAFVFANDAGHLSGVSLETGLVGLSGGSVAWGDHDGDGDLDLLLSGLDAAGKRFTTLFDNQGTAHANQPPQPPPQLNAPRVTSNSVLFTWAPGSDPESSEVTYNLRVGTQEGGHDIVSGVRLPGPGNAGFKTSTLLRRTLAPDAYYWNVQTVDGAFDTSAWLPHDGVFNVQQFVSSAQRLRAVSEATMVWGDYDGDGDPDLLLAGLNRSGEAQSLLYENRNGKLVLDADSDLQGIRNGDAAWGDYDNDGDLDLLLTGEDTFLNKRALLYRAQPMGDDYGLQLIGQFPDVGWSAVDWGDYDGDGDLDLALMGLSDDVVGGREQAYTRIFVNQGELSFAPAPFSLLGLYNGDLCWIDYDLDGDLDLAEIGKESTGELRFLLYRNDNGSMTRVSVDVEGLDASAMAWADYDGDGDPDLAVLGKGAGGQVTRVYTNNGGGVFDLLEGTEFPGVWGGDLIWGDYDNDQDPDLIITGSDRQGHPVLRVFENRDGVFVQDELPLLTGLDLSAVSLADYDGDGDLDLFSAGRDSVPVPQATVNENLEAQFNPNRPPAAPQLGTALDSADTVRLVWAAATDEFDLTPASLTYNVRVGTTADGNDIVSGRCPTGAGNNGQRLFRRVSGLASGTYSWSVQTVDDGFATSAWAQAGTFTVDTIAPVVDDVSLNRSRLGLGQAVTMAVAFFDAHSGMDPSVEPRVMARVGDSTYAFQSLQYTGGMWSGALTVTAAMPSGKVGIVIEGAVDRKGNPMAPYYVADVLSVDTQAPAVAASTPAAGAADVPVGTRAVTVRFTEPIDETAVVGANFRLREGGELLSLLTAPTYDSATNSVTLRPESSLRPGTEYTVTVGALVQDLFGNTLGDAVSWVFQTRVPQLVQKSPTGLAADTTRQIRAVFDGLLDTARVKSAAVHLYREGVAVELAAGSPRFDLGSNTLILEPADGLLPGSHYQVLLDGALAGPQRVQGEGDFSWRFQTPVPGLIGTSPPVGAEDLESGAATIIATFDRQVDAQALAAGGVTVLAGGEEVPVGPVEYNPDTRAIRMFLVNGLRVGTAYEVRLAASLGGPLRTGDYTWRFSTAVPRLVWVAPDSGAGSVPITLSAAVAQFSVPLDVDQAVNSSFVLLEEGTAVALRAEDPLALGDGRYALAPAAGWQVGRRYRIQIAPSVQGPLGKNTQPLSWSFTTLSPDTLSVTPKSGDRTVTPGPTEVRARFEGPIDQGALRAGGAVGILQDGRPVKLKAVNYDAETFTLRLEPAAGLRAGSTYQVTLAAGLGGPLRQHDGPFAWGFSTRVPGVQATSPAADEEIPSGSHRIAVHFSCPVDQDLISPENFQLRRGGTLIPLSADGFDYDPDSSVVSYPPVVLLSGSKYTATVLARVSGPLGAAQPDYEWSFRTQVPRVVSVWPEPGQDGVPTGVPSIQVKFSQAVARQDAELFQVVARALDDTSGAFSLVNLSVPSARDSAGSLILSFAPLEGLRPFTAYRVTVAPEVLGDLAVSGYSWMFSTASRLTDVTAGGTVRNQTGSVELYFPPNALVAGADEVRIQRLSAEAAGALTAPAVLTRITDAYAIRIDGAVVRKPVSLTMRYSSAQLDTRDPARLGVFRWQDGQGWKRLGGVGVADERAVQTAVDGFGIFALFEDRTTQVGSAAIRSLDCQPRAFAPAGGRGRARTDISFRLTGPADVTVRVYSTAGRLTRIITRARPMAPGRISLPWDGRDLDHKVVASGLYIVVVDADGDRAEKVVAVIR